MPSVYIEYGVGEGDRIGYRMLDALTVAGFHITKNAQEAQIIMVHSGGIFTVPIGAQPRCLMLINPTYWPRQSFAWSEIHKIQRDFRACWRRKAQGYWLRKTAWNILYLVRDLFSGRAHIMLTGIRATMFTEKLPQCPLIIVRNHDDAWYTPDQKDMSPKTLRPYTVHQLPGEHDDCWFNPKPYVQLLQNEYAKL